MHAERGDYISVGCAVLSVDRVRPWTAEEGLIGCRCRPGKRHKTNKQTNKRQN